MELVTEKPAVVFDLSKIRRGDLLWGRHCTWRDGRSGMVTSATEAQLTVQYCPGIGNITNHFIIPAAEAAGGEWEIRWSADLMEVQEYGGREEGRLPKPGEGEDSQGSKEAENELLKLKVQEDLHYLEEAEGGLLKPNKAGDDSTKTGGAVKDDITGTDL